MITQGLKTCNCKLPRNWPFMVSYCKHGFMLFEERKPFDNAIRRPLESPIAVDQVQGKGVVAKAPLEGLEGL